MATKGADETAGSAPNLFNNIGSIDPVMVPQITTPTKVKPIVMAINIQSKIVIMGDLNDDPISPSLTKVLNAKGSVKGLKDGGLYNPWYDFYKNGIGTIAYQDSWGLFDQVVISKAWLDKTQPGYHYYRATIFNREFLVQQTGKYKGYPKRTWDGTTYNYGYSDHFPVFITLLKKAD